jgi:Ca2+:H+ antiporter
VAASAVQPETGFTRREQLTFAVVGITCLAALGLRLADADPTVVFAVSGVAVAGLAYVLGDATAQAGEAAGTQIAAFLNATFGNLPELVIVILTLREGLVDVARASIAGSVLGNMLLILGSSLLFGGLRHERITFDRRRAGMNASMLTIAVVALGVPTLFAQLSRTTPHDGKAHSHGTAVVMQFLYAAYLVQSLQQPQVLMDGDEEPGSRWTARQAAIVLSLTALATGVLSEVLVSSIKPTIADTGIGPTFIGLIIVPLIGNVAEHAAAIRIAWRGDFDFAMGISFNSALQVAFGVTAIAVFAGALVGHELSIVFPSLQIALLAASAVMVGLIAADGEANWLEGLELIAIYTLAGIAFWYL